METARQTYLYSGDLLNQLKKFAINPSGEGFQDGGSSGGVRKFKRSRVAHNVSHCATAPSGWEPVAGTGVAKQKHAALEGAVRGA